jgi:4-amino-4-deoxy-L-arabinose transferase-like glycosyltransferase
MNLNALKGTITAGLIKLGIKKEKALLIILLILSFVMFFYKLGAPSLFETDEVIYSQVAREMVRTGDWITMHLFSHNWFIHPPFYMWLTAASSYVFGDNEFNARLWNALFAVGLVFATYLLGRKMFKGGVGILAGFIIATGLQYIIQARIATFDIPLVFFEILSLLFFFYWLEDKLPRYYYLFFLMLGLAVLMKGPVGIVLPLFVMITYLSFTGGLKDLFNFRMILGLIIAFLAGGTWYTAQTLIHGRVFLDSIFGFYTTGMYLVPIEQHFGPWYFYLPVMIIGFMPWISFLPFSIAYQWKNRGDSDNLFAILWLGIVFIFFSIAGTKLPGYIMSLYPLAAISVSKMIQDHLSGENSGLPLLISRAYKTLAVFSIALLVIAASIRMFEFPDIIDKFIVNVTFTLLILGIGGIISSLWFFKKRGSIAPIVVLVITMLVFSVYTAGSIMITLDDFKPMKAISQRINSQYMGNEVIIGYKVLNKGSFMHYLDKPVVWVGNILELREYLKLPEKMLLITNERDFLNLGHDNRESIFFIYKAGDMVLLSNQK